MPASYKFSVSLGMGGGKLSLSGSGLSEVPGELAQLRSLTSLDLSSNNLSSPPLAASKLVHLRILNLSANHSLTGLTPLPMSLASLDISNCSALVCPLPRLVAMLPHTLVELKVRNWGISDASALRNLGRLVSVDLSENPLLELDSLPGRILSLRVALCGIRQFPSYPPFIFFIFIEFD